MELFQKVREQLISEMNVRNKTTDQMIYRIAVTLLNYDIDLADSFMTSPNFGGFTPGQLNRIKTKASSKSWAKIK